jgi:hypothetical protein
MEVICVFIYHDTRVCVHINERCWVNIRMVVLIMDITLAV